MILRTYLRTSIDPDGVPTGPPELTFELVLDSTEVEPVDSGG